MRFYTFLEHLKEIQVFHDFSSGGCTLTTDGLNDPESWLAYRPTQSTNQPQAHIAKKKKLYKSTHLHLNNVIQTKYNLY